MGPKLPEAVIVIAGHRYEMDEKYASLLQSERVRQQLADVIAREAQRILRQERVVELAALMLPEDAKLYISLQASRAAQSYASDPDEGAKVFIQRAQRLEAEAKAANQDAPTERPTQPLGEA